MKSKFTFQLAETKEEIQKASKLILKYKLHLNVGSMSDWAKGHRKANSIVICRLNRRPIAAGMYIESSDHYPNVGIYVNPEFRRKGVGTEVFKHLSTKISSEPIKYATGYSFYTKMASTTSKPMIKIW